MNPFLVVYRREARRAVALPSIMPSVFTDETQNWDYFATNPQINIDDVTGDVIPPCMMAVQQGLIRDIRVSRGSWETMPVQLAYEQFVTYNPALGVQARPYGSPAGDE